MLHLGHRGRVQAALVGEGAGAHVRLRGRGRHICDLRHVPPDLGQRGKLRVGDAVDALLDLEIGDNRKQVGVAAPLSVAVDRALDVRDPGVHRGQGACHGQLRVVVSMDA